MSQIIDLDWRETAELARPTNYTRNLYHAANGVFVSWLVLHLLSNEGMVLVAGSVALLAWTIEVTRRIWPAVNDAAMKVWGKTAHPHELTQLNSGTWIVTAMFIIALLYGNIEACVGVVVCGFGDPAAALIGRKFGRLHIAGGRTLEGTTAFVVVGGAATWLLLALYLPHISASQGAVIAVLAALCGALAELFAPVDDNLSIPVVSATAGWLTMAAMGLSPTIGWLFI